MIRALLFIFASAAGALAAPLITEFVAENDRGLRDADQQKRDWIEIHNPGSVPLSLDDFFLTDDAALPQKWRLPARLLAPGEFYVVFASGLDRRDAAGDAHTNFALANSGEYLALSGPNGIVQAFSPAFPPQVADVSFGIPMSAQETVLVSSATPANILIPQSAGDLPDSWTTSGFAAPTKTGPAAVGYQDGGGISAPGLVLHCSLDNADAGAGQGTDSTLGGPFAVRDTAGAAENGLAQNVLAASGTTNAHVTSGAPGKIGQALQFDPASVADNRAVDFGDVLNAGIGDYTVSVWFNTASATEQQFIAGKGNSSSSAAGWSVFLENGTLVARVGGGTTANRGSQSKSGLTANTWHHVALVVNQASGTVTAYLNGSNAGWVHGGGGPASNSFPPGTSLSNINPLRLGIRADGAAEFRGLLDDFAIWNRALSTGEVATLFSEGNDGRAVMDGGSFGGLIGTNVQSEMQGHNASAFLHVPFAIAGGVADIHQLRLRMRYDDGFIAWINGVEVARRRAPVGAAWNASAAAGPDALQDETLDLSAHLALLLPGENVLAIQGLNAAASDADFLVVPEFIATSFATETASYFLTPTPGAANTTPAVANALPIVTFNPPAGVFTGSQAVTLQGAPAGGVIRYTLDGSGPSAASPAYGAPLDLASSAEVRARIFMPGETGGRVTAAAFVKLGGDVQNFASPLPIVVMDNFARGDIPNYRAANPPTGDGSGLRQVNRQPAFMAFYDRAAAGGSATLAAPPALMTRVGARVRGSSSASQPKKRQGCSIEAWSSMDEHSRSIQPFGLPGDPDWVLQAPYNYDRALIRNAVAYELMRGAGHYAPRTRFVQAFIDTDGGELTMADYAGVFVWTESIKRDDDRVNLHGLSEDGTAGGWMVQSDRMDPLPEDGRNTPPWHFHTAGPNGIKQGPHGGSAAADQGGDDIPTGYNTFLNFAEPSGYDSTAAQRGAIVQWFDDFEDALYGANYKDPVAGYASWLDTHSFIDHFALTNLTRNVDDLQLSTHMFRRHAAGRLHLNPPWDYDRSMDSYDPRDDNVTGTYGAAFLWFPRLFSDPCFAQRQVDRWQELRRGSFSTASMHALIDAMAAEITAPVAAANFARWNAAENTPRSGGWPAEIEALKTWLAARAAWIDAQHAQPPIFSEAPGEVAPGTLVALSAPAGTIYYTLDGSDVLVFSAAGLGVSPAATGYTGPLPINATTTVVARAFAGGQWSGPVSATFTVGVAPAAAGNLVISELHYNPAAPTAAEDPAGTRSGTDFEFVELLNISGGAINLEGVRVIGDVQFEFAGGVILGAGERIVIVEDLSAFRARYGEAARVAGEYSGNLSNSGAEIAVVDKAGADIIRFTFGDRAPWPGAADEGRSLTLIAPSTNPPAGDPRNWRSSVNLGGTPGDTDGVALSGNPAMLAAHAFGGDGSALPAVTIQGGIGTLAFRRNLAADDVVYRVERATQLPQWSTDLSLTFLGETNHGDGTATLAWQFAMPAGDRGLFFRVVASVAPQF